MDQTETIPSNRPARDWLKILAEYRKPVLARSIFEIAVTLIPFIVLWVLAWYALDVGYWLTFLFSVPAAAFLVRLFLIQHDCGHGAFFASRKANDWIGRCLGVLTFTPYEVWRRSHAAHHATSGNLDLRGLGDITTITVEEYRARPWWSRLAYRLYREPIVMFGVGPAAVFLLQYRLPFGQMDDGWKPWVSAMGTNIAIAIAAAAMIYLIGLEAFLLVHMPIVVMAASIGVWLFYVQHQFEDTYWEKTKNWSHADAALYGSSHYDLPVVLRWLSANIGVHHVHHLYSRIPFYRLQEVLRDYPELSKVRRLTLSESFACVKYKLWSETQKRLVTFREAHAVG